MNNNTPRDARRSTATGSPISAGEYPIGISVSPNGAKAYVVNSGGQAAKAESAPARIKVKAGSSAIVPLKPKKAFNSRLTGASRILVVETSTIAGVTDKRVRLLRVVS